MLNDFTVNDEDFKWTGTGDGTVVCYDSEVL